MFVLPLLFLSSFNPVHGVVIKQANVLLVAPGAPAFDACNASYLGTYDSLEPVAIYAIPESCQSFDSLNSGSLVSLEDVVPNSSLVWVEEVVAEGALRDSEPSF